MKNLKNTKWFYRLDGLTKVEGPVTMDDLIDLYIDGNVSKSTYFVEDLGENVDPPNTSSDGWKPLSELKELEDFFKTSMSSVVDTVGDEKSESEEFKPPPPPPPNPHLLSEVEFDETLGLHVTKDRKLEYSRNFGRWIAHVDPSKIQSVMSFYEYVPPGGKKEEKVLENKTNLVDEPPSVGLKRKRDESDTGDNEDSSPPLKKRKVEEEEKKKLSNVNDQVIYVTGLPKNIKIEEVHQYFSKCGIVKNDEETGLPRIKLYRDDQGNLKGDCSVEYLLAESVKLAIQLLHETQIQPGHLISVEKALVFKSKKDIDRWKKRKKKKSGQLKKLEWTLDDDDLDWTFRSVLIKNMFTLEEFDEDPLFHPELKKEVKEECAKKCGEVERIRFVYDEDHEVVSCLVHIVFKYQYSAQKCKELMNGRYFDQKRLVAYFYDGKQYKSVSQRAKEQEDMKILEAFAKEQEQKEEKKNDT